MPLTVISLGAGVQSTAMALMAAHGEITPMPDCAIFADTQWEPAAVYRHLDWLCGVLPFPVHRVTAGNIVEHIERNPNCSGQRFASVPWFTENGGMARRQCTREFKVEPIAKEVRRLLGFRPRQRIPEKAVEMWLGISSDEAMRMKPSFNSWQVNRWPLIEKGINRRRCLAWIDAHSYPTPAKSSCIGCPYHSDEHWRRMRDYAPDEWEEACRVDKVLRNGGHKMKYAQFMHRSLVPLAEVDLSPRDWGQMDLFNNDCEGMCGA
jgi:hypothetical protein